MLREVAFDVPWRTDLQSTGLVNTVATILPVGYDAYLRIFHPFVPWQADFGPVERVRTWGSMADEAGVAFTPTLTYRQLAARVPGLSPRRRERRWAVWEGELEPLTADALFGALSDDPGETWSFAFELAALTAGVPARRYEGEPEDRLEAVSAALASGVVGNSPELVWPPDRRWIVYTDWDLTSTYVAADRRTADRVLGCDRLEVVEVSSDTRIDDAADEQR